MNSCWAGTESSWILPVLSVLFQVLLIISQIKLLLRKGIWFIGRMFQAGFIALE